MSHEIPSVGSSDVNGHSNQGGSGPGRHAELAAVAAELEELSPGWLDRYIGTLSAKVSALRGRPAALNVDRQREPQLADGTHDGDDAAQGGGRGADALDESPAAAIDGANGRRKDSEDAERRARIARAHRHLKAAAQMVGAPRAVKQMHEVELNSGEIYAIAALVSEAYEVVCELERDDRFGGRRCFGLMCAAKALVDSMQAEDIGADEVISGDPIFGLAAVLPLICEDVARVLDGAAKVAAVPVPERDGDAAGRLEDYAARAWAAYNAIVAADALLGCGRQNVDGDDLRALGVLVDQAREHMRGLDHELDAVRAGLR